MSTTPAVEVATLFEDTVLSVRHLHAARPPATRTTRMLLGAGLVSLVGAFLTFVVNVHQVGALRRAHDAALSSGRVHGPFLLPGGGRWLDFVVASALVVGTFLLVQGLLRMLAERRSRDFVVGPSPRADVAAPLDEDRPLVAVSEAGFELQLAPPMRAEVQSPTGTQTIVEARNLLISEGTRALVDLGALRFVVQATSVPAPLPAPVRFDWKEEAYIGAVGLAAGVFLGLLYLIPPDPKSLALDTIHSDFVAHYVIKAPEPPPLPTLPKSGPVGGDGGRAHAGPAGSMGTHDVKPGTHAKLELKGNNKVDPKVARATANQIASQTAVLGILRNFEGSSTGSVFAREDALGPDARNSLGDLIGTQPGNAYGEGGMDLVGSGKGGGGQDNTTIGVDPNGLRTIGHDGRLNVGGKYVPGGNDKMVHTVGKVDPIGDPKVRVGNLSKDIIRRVIHAHHNEIKFCYEKRLMSKQVLEGRVVTRFMISGMGRVIGSNVEMSTVNDPQVEGCITDAVRRWEFPRPNDGSLVVVSYPFVLHAPGQ